MTPTPTPPVTSGIGSTALPWNAEIAGRIDRHVIDSQLLRGNPLNDPSERPLWVYVPPGYDADERRYPAIYFIQGYTGYLTMWENRTAFRRPFTETVDDVFRDGTVPGCLVVFVDTWTSYGGSQFVDSIGTGRYHSYLCDEVVPWVDQHYRTIPSPGSRAIAGKSSGGYGAMITPLLRPDLFSALATHSGDALFELPYASEFGDAARALRAYDGDITVWWADFNSRVAFSKPHDGMLLELWGVAACFSPDEHGRPQLPFDQRTGATRTDVWERWLTWDPVRMVPGRLDAARSLTSVWIDAGTSDNYYLDLGALEFADTLRRAGVPDDAIHCELFEGTHAATEYRYPLSVGWLAKRLAS
jgi:S-formylglutathione hydrolase FrmB